MYSTSPPLIQRSVEHFQRHELVPASQLLQKILYAQPRQFDALHLLGVIRAMEGRYDEAIDLLRKALGVSKNHAQLQFNLARALSDAGRDGEALLHHRKATQLAPGNAEAWLNLGDALQKQDDLEGALQAFDEAVRRAPHFAQAWNNRGTIFKLLGRPVEALASYEKALILKPDLAEVHLHMGAALEDIGNDAGAMMSYRKAAQLNPDLINARRSIAELQLKSGNFQEGWEDFELRWKKQGIAAPKLMGFRPLWTGDRSEKQLLLWGEQGIGDQILYASILPELTDFPQRKLLALDRRLIPLFARSMPGFELLDLETVSDALPFAEQLPLGSLPRHFRPTAQSFANARHPYLRADAARSAALREQIARPGQRVCGVAWNSLRKYIGPGKSASLAQMLAPLAGLPLHFVDLQYGDTREEREALQRSHGIEVQHVEEIDNFHDLDGLAALIQACDVVLTTSNSTAHLAGALGKNTLLLLPLSRFWYWINDQGRNPWYSSMQLFSQIRHNDWQEPLAQVRHHLQKHYGT